MSYDLKNLEAWNEKIEKIAIKNGLNYYSQEFEMIGYNEMLGYEAYVGMPSRYPHWSFGKAYEKNRTLYKYNLTGLPYEMVINSDPCLAYLMRENTELLHILTMAHVYGHNDFFKNNRLFKIGTDANYTVEMFKHHANTIRSFINDPSIGYIKVERILDAAHSLKLQTSRTIGEKRITYEEKRTQIIDEYIRKLEDKTLLDGNVELEAPDISKIPLSPEDDILYFIIKYGHLQDFEKSILEVVRNETAYFIPQIETKIMNEGWASFWHYNILKELELPDNLNFEFMKRHNDVVAPIIGGINPYYLGFKIFENLERDYGREKIFQVREMERDSSFIRRYLTEELCYDLNLFEYLKRGSDFVITEVSDGEGWKEIRNSISSSCGMGSVPYIRVKEFIKKDNILLLEHVYDGRELNLKYSEQTIKYAQELWGGKVILETLLEGKKIRLICDENKAILKE